MCINIDCLQLLLLLRGKAAHLFASGLRSTLLSQLQRSLSISHQAHRICKESIGYNSNDIEIFITAYETTASIIKQTRAYRAHPLLPGPKLTWH